jgi:hypothetical protein
MNCEDAPFTPYNSTRPVVLAATVDGGPFLLACGCDVLITQWDASFYSDRGDDRGRESRDLPINAVVPTPLPSSHYLYPYGVRSTVLPFAAWSFIQQSQLGVQFMAQPFREIENVE